MNSKVVSIALVILTVLIFGGNYFLARSQNDCSGPCQAKITFLRRTLASARGHRKEPSCSLKVNSSYNVFLPNVTRYVQLKDGDCLDLNKNPDLPPETVVFCDEEMSVEIEVKGSKIDFSSNPKIPASISLGGGAKFHIGGGKLTLSCEVSKHLDWFLLYFIKPSGDVKFDYDFESWVSRKQRTGSRLNVLQPTRSMTFSHHQRLNFDLPEDEVVTGVERMRVVNGDVGIEKNRSGQRQMLIAAGGEAEVESFCTGDLLTLVGPSALSLPACEPVKVSRSWQGAYARRLSKKEIMLVPFNLNFREETSGGLGGQLQNPDGIFNITHATLSTSGFSLEAERKEAGTPRRIEISGYMYDAGDLTLTGRESSGVAGSLDYNIEGFARRLYIADHALLPAAVNQPYSFTLTGISPEDTAITFRLAGGRLPRGTSFDGRSGTLNGTPTELGNFNIRVLAEDASGNVFEQPLTLAVKKLVVTNRLLPDAFVGQPYTTILKVAGGLPPYRFSGTPPIGLKLDPNTGELSGTPSSPNDNPGFEVTVRDSQNNSESEHLTLRVSGTTILTSHFLPEATQGLPYHTQFQVVGNSSPIKWSIAGGDIGSIGLTLDQRTGELSGTPTRAGAFLLSVKAQASDSQSRNFALTIKQGQVVLGSEQAEAQKSEYDSRRAVGQAWNYNPSEHRSKNGQRFTYVCPANGEDYGCLGTDIYADRSSLCTAAVHAGLITFERGGTVTIEIRPGQSSYQGSRRNGVNSRSWHAEDGSFVFIH